MINTDPYDINGPKFLGQFNNNNKPSHFTLHTLHVYFIAGESPVKPPSPDLRYYRKLMSKIPVESESVPLIMDCLLEQVCEIK